MRGLSWGRVACAGLLAAGLAVAVGCSRAEELPKKEPAAPALVVRDDSQGLLFTWIDEKGDFHVEDSPERVPAAHREAVRVLEPTRAEDPDQIAVVDLRTKQGDGTYPVASKPRASFEALALGRRNALRPEPGQKPAGDAPQAAGAAVAERPAGQKKSVTVYGASWCGACQQTRAYLKQKGVAFSDKDIDADSSAAREMRAKLAKAGIQGNGIPVIDVGGKLMVGFDPGAIERALRGG